MLKSKFSLFFFSALISLTFLYSCKKDNSASEGTQWSVDSFNFSSDKKAGVMLETDTATLFGASTTSKDAILLLFKKRPSAGMYYVVNTQVKTNVSMYEDNECSMIITNKTGGVVIYLPLTDDAGTVDISVSGKKITASFSNVNLGYIDPSSGDLVPSLASGTIIEK